MKLLIILFFALSFSQSSYAGVLKDFDGLGDNKDLFDTAKALHPDMKVVVVQDRVVDRRNRFEFGLGASYMSGGDAYIDSYGYGANLQYHITPWISVGAKYDWYTNNLNKEGENIIYDVDANNQGIIPDIDFLRYSYMGTINIYPIYGKMNMFNLGITHFDVYGTLGYGDMVLKNGKSATWTAGAGVGFWFSQYLSTRLEIKHQSYSAKRYDNNDKMESIVGTLQIGVLL